MLQDARVGKLIAGISEIVGRPIGDADASIGDLGIDSKFLIDIMMVCEDIYGSGIDFAAIEIGYETSLLNIHHQLSDHVDRRASVPVGLAAAAPNASVSAGREQAWPEIDARRRNAEESR